MLRQDVKDMRLEDVERTLFYHVVVLKKYDEYGKIKLRLNELGYGYYTDFVDAAHECEKNVGYNEENLFERIFNYFERNTEEQYMKTRFTILLRRVHEKTELLDTEPGTGSSVLYKGAYFLLCKKIEDLKILIRPNRRNYRWCNQMRAIFEWNEELHSLFEKLFFETKV
jgi:hypothetical protein